MSTETRDSATENTFGARLAAARKAKGLTQEELGIGMGSDGRDLGKAAVSSWEVGASFPNASQVMKLCGRLGVSANHLLGTGRKPSKTD